jgi:uncharacterized protein YndB with AHSA1/START domain
MEMTENNASTSATNAAGSELAITHVLHVPREVVFKVWADMDHLKKWWCPEGFTINESKLGLRPSGVYHYSMKSHDGQEMWGKLVYNEIVASEKIVFIKSFTDPDGNTVRTPFSPAFPLEIQNVLTFKEKDGKTTLTIRGRPINATEEEIQFFTAMHGNMLQSFGGTFRQLDEYLACI